MVAGLIPVRARVCRMADTLSEYTADGGEKISVYTYSHYQRILYLGCMANTLSLKTLKTEVTKHQLHLRAQVCRIVDIRELLYFV